MPASVIPSPTIPTVVGDFLIYSHFFIMANATTPPAKKQFLFVRDTVIEAENEEQAKDIFADDSFWFAEGAECYEVCEKCFPHVAVTTCRCAIIP